MELQLKPGQSRERPVHGFGREPCHVAAGRSDTGMQDFHDAAASSGTFFLEIIAVGRAWDDLPLRLSSLVGLCCPRVASHWA